MGTTVADVSYTARKVGRPCQREIQELRTVIARCMPSFYRQALRRLKNVADAEDAVQDGLLSAWEHLDQFKRQAKMSTWVTSIVINAARMRVRRRPQQLHISLDGQDREQGNYLFLETLADPRPNPEELCQKRELSERLAQFSAELPPEMRRTFQLRAMDGLSISDTAKVLGVASATVKSRIARARRRLRLSNTAQSWRKAQHDLRRGLSKAKRAARKAASSSS